MELLRLAPLSFAVLFASACATSSSTATPAATATATAAVDQTTPAERPPKADLPAVSDDPLVNRIVALGMTDSTVNPLLVELTNEFGPRLTSSHALMKAERWARDKFEEFGLVATLEPWGAFPVGFDRGPWSGAMVAPERVELDFVTPSWTPGVTGPARGPALFLPSSVAEVEALNGRARGAWIVLRPADFKLGKKKLDRITSALAQGGVHGYVMSARDTERGLVHTWGDPRIDWDDLPTDVEVSLRADQFADIASRLGRGEEVELEFSIDNRFFRGPVPQHNVIADIPGTDKADEYVIIGGHIDSWDGASGVVDNGTGVATTLEAARLLAKAGVKPRRTIRFMLWSGEEQGLLGSMAYVKAHPELMDKISVVLVHDGGTNFLSGLSVTPEMAAQARAVFEPVIALGTFPFALFYAKELRPGGSDHNSFIRAGVPGFFWQQSGKADYQRAHHTQHDNLDAYVPEYQQHSALVVALAAYGFANLDEMLDRTHSKPLPTRRMLGVILDGLAVTGLSESGKARALGVKKGDVIASINGTALQNRRDLWKAMRAHADNDRLEVVVKRGKRKLSFTFDYSNDANKRARETRHADRVRRFGELVWDQPFAGKAAPAPKHRAHSDGR